jgi:autophagy-related protein 101
VLDITLPFVQDAELDTMIEKRAAELDRELSAERTHAPHSAGEGGTGSGGRGNISVQFFEKKRRKTWYMRAAYGGGDEEVCWECWTVKVTVAEPRTESGAYIPLPDRISPSLWTTCGAESSPADTPR